MLDQWIGRDLVGARHDILRWNVDAPAIRAKGDAMIATDDRIALQTAFAQGEMPVRTAPADRNRLAIFLAIQDDRLVQDRPRQQVTAQFVAKRGNIPAIANGKRPFPKWVHGISP